MRCSRDLCCYWAFIPLSFAEILLRCTFRGVRTGFEDPIPHTPMTCCGVDRSNRSSSKKSSSGAEVRMLTLLLLLCRSPLTWRACTGCASYVHVDEGPGKLHRPRDEKATELLNKQQSSVIRYWVVICLLYTSPSPRDRQKSRMPSSA